MAKRRANGGEIFVIGQLDGVGDNTLAGYCSTDWKTNHPEQARQSGNPETLKGLVGKRQTA